jgi:hypothetical protein
MTKFNFGQWLHLPCKMVRYVIHIMQALVVHLEHSVNIFKAPLEAGLNSTAHVDRPPATPENSRFPQLRRRFPHRSFPIKTSFYWDSIMRIHTPEFPQKRELTVSSSDGFAMRQRQDMTMQFSTCQNQPLVQQEITWRKKTHKPPIIC